MMLPDMERLRREVRGRLSPKRYAHSLAVRDRAVTLARLHGYDWYKAGVAGLIHDICKEMGDEAQLNYLRSCGIMLDVFTQAQPQIWHGITGACFAQKELGIQDEEILLAVRYHTTGRAAMTLGEKVIYLADLTSADRDFPDVAHVRQLSEDDLDEAMRYCLTTIMERLIRQGKPLVPSAVEAYNYYAMQTCCPAEDAGVTKGSRT